MRFTRLAPAEATSIVTPPTSRRSAFFIGASSGSVLLILMSSNSSLFSDQVSAVPLILTDHFQQFGVGQQVHFQVRRPGSSVCLGIVNGDADLHVSEIQAPEALDNMQSLGLRTADFRVQPIPVVEAG